MLKAIMGAIWNVVIRICGGLPRSITFVQKEKLLLKRILCGVLIFGFAGFPSLLNLSAAWRNTAWVQLPAVLKTVALVLVAIVGAHWLVLGTIDGGLALAWWVRWPATPRWRIARHLVGFLNRQALHLEAGGGLLVLILTLPLDFISSPRWSYLFEALKLPLAIILLFYSAAVLERLATWLQIEKHICGPDAGGSAEEATRHWARRPLFYLVTVASFTYLLIVSGQYQRQEILRLSALILASVLVRGLLWIRDSQFRSGAQPAHPEAVEAGDTMVRLARWDRWVSFLVIAVALIPFVEAALGERESTQEEHQRLQPSRSWAEKDLSDPSVSLYIVADNQFHELGGQGSGIQTDLVDRLVPVAVRPVELDLLSGATLAQFAKTYSELSGRGRKSWTHLGDIGDLGCNGEILRFEKYYLDRFKPRNSLAALVPGNHDSMFTGNFAWDPEWNHACKSGPCVKTTSNNHFARMSKEHGSTETTFRVVEHPISHFMHVERTGFASLARLGTVGDREVIGAFLDSSDYTGLSLGVAGMQGQISNEQYEWLQGQLDQHQRAWVLLFMHHPLTAFSIVGHSRVEKLAASLGDRLMAIVSAHTHTVAFRRHRLAGREVPEMVVGSTTDPPQEATLLDIGASPRGGINLSFRTIPAVTPDNSPPLLSTGIHEHDCRQMLDALRAKPSCAALFNTDQDHCEKKETDRRGRASTLLGCLCRDGRCAEPANPLDDEAVVPLVEHLIDDDTARQEMVCLSWAAAALQAHKADKDQRLHCFADAANNVFPPKGAEPKTHLPGPVSYVIEREGDDPSAPRPAPPGPNGGAPVARDSP